MSSVSNAPFEILPWSVNAAGNTLQFDYVCPRYGAFSEHIEFPIAASLETLRSREFADLAGLLACALAVSYYKLMPATALQIAGHFTDTQKQMVRALFIQGLGEFYARNAQDYPPKITFNYIAESLGETYEGLTAPVENTAPIIAFGGGKDSNVSLEILSRLGYDCEAVSVVLSEKTQGKLASMSIKELTFIHRRLDPKLFALNKNSETLNGHVPITAMNSLILTIYALMNNQSWVVFSNERGSSQFTRLYQGAEINHQFSKSLGFETLLVEAISQATQDRVQYFSMLRPYSEIWIGKMFARLCQSAWSRMASCNKNFIFHSDAGLDLQTRWCGTCSKCVYTALIIAPFVTPEDFETIFQTDIFEHPDNTKIARSLCGLGGEKPWECVGDIQDTRAVTQILCVNKNWENAHLFRDLNPSLTEIVALSDARKRVETEIAAIGQHHLPEGLFAKIQAVTKNL